MNATISSYPSPYFPILLTWHTGSITHTAVFPTEREATYYITSRYGTVTLRRSDAE